MIRALALASLSAFALASTASFAEPITGMMLPAKNTKAAPSKRPGKAPPSKRPIAGKVVKSKAEPGKSKR